MTETDSSTDSSLVAGARAGNAGAYETLLRRHFRAAYLVAAAIVGEPADAEDICQDAFVRAWERLDDCRDPARFRAWLCQIVRNRALNHVRRSPTRRTVSFDRTRVPASARASPAADVQRTELAARLRAAVAALPIVQREVVLLHDLEGFRHADVAATLDISVTMSRRHLSDARRSLRRLLGDYETLEPDYD